MSLSNETKLALHCIQRQFPNCADVLQHELLQSSAVVDAARVIFDDISLPTFEDYYYERGRALDEALVHIVEREG